MLRYLMTPEPANFECTMHTCIFALLPVFRKNTSQAPKPRSTIEYSHQNIIVHQFRRQFFHKKKKKSKPRNSEVYSPWNPYPTAALEYDQCTELRLKNISFFKKKNM